MSTSHILITTFRFLSNIFDLRPREPDSDDAPLCGAPCGYCGSSCSVPAAAKRDVLDVVSSNLTSTKEAITLLQKRKFEGIAQGDINSYLEGIIGQLDQISRTNQDQIGLFYKGTICCFEVPQETEYVKLTGNADARGDDYTYGIEKKFSDYTGTGKTFNLGCHYLTGCTVITLVSTEAVYMVCDTCSCLCLPLSTISVLVSLTFDWQAHIWESLAFDPNYRRKPRLTKPQTEEAWKKNCINLLTNTQPRDTRGDSPTPSLYEGKSPYLFIMSPRPFKPRKGSLAAKQERYVTKNQEIIDTIKGLIPDITVVKYNYQTPDTKEYTEYYQGTALLQFDANADEEGRPNSGSGMKRPWKTDGILA